MMKEELPAEAGRIDDERQTEMLDGKKRFAHMFQSDIQALNEKGPVSLVENEEPPDWYKEGRSPYQAQRDGSNPDFPSYPATLDLDPATLHERLRREIGWALEHSALDEEARAETLDSLERLIGRDAMGAALMERWRLLGAELLAHGAPRALVDQLGLPVEAWDLHATVEQSVELNRPVSALQPVEPNVVLNADWRVVPLRQVMRMRQALAEARRENARMRDRLDAVARNATALLEDD